MAQQPAVVIIARHGARLDAADQSWHLSTPTPYDPPLTYGGWNQCRSLGVRIAHLLHAREQEAEAANESDGVKTHDFASLNGDRSQARDIPGDGKRRRRGRRHKVVIHSSPFLRCLQTSVAIAAGMAECAPAVEAANQQQQAKNRRKSAAGQGKGSPSPTLAPIHEPKDDFAHSIARRNLQEHRRPRRCKLRVDAFLGEWLNPQYFDQITPPPPSSMMMTTAKAELMQNDSVDTFVPTTLNRTSGGNLWGSGNAQRGSALDDWSHVQEDLPVRKRERASSQSSAGSSSSASRRRSPYRPGGALQPLTSYMPKPEFSVYTPPTPHYAVSSADYIPRGYVAHARSACANVDYHWDSARAPLSWGDGGELGEEWSAMHKRFRKGLNHLIEWYSRHNADDRSEDALGIDQAERDDEDEAEDLVVIMVTHGAGCNALIGALTGQPVLLDVGMASLTMAVRRDDAPPIITYASTTAPTSEDPTDGAPRLSNRTQSGSLDLGLSSVYEMKLVSSSEHLRPRTEREPSPSVRADIKSARESLAKHRQRYGSAAHASGQAASFDLGQPSRGNTSSLLGSIRRPSTSNAGAPAPLVGVVGRSNSIALGETISRRDSSSPGLWTPPGARTPSSPAQPPVAAAQVDGAASTALPDVDEDSVDPLTVIPGPERLSPQTLSPAAEDSGSEPSGVADAAVNGSVAALKQHGDSADSSVLSSDEDTVTDLPRPGDSVPQSLRRGLSQKGLWGARPSGDRVARLAQGTPKRRWTIIDDK